MKLTDIPYKFSVPWAVNAPGTNITNPIPVSSQPGGRASFNDGYAPINSTPVAAGGIPPWASDTNGVLFAETSWSRWLQAGGPIQYDGAFQSAVGGYMMGAIVASATTFGRWWLSTADSNMSDPDTGGANWTVFAFGRLLAVTVYNTAGTFTHTFNALMSTCIATVQGAGSAGAGCTLPSVGNVSVGSAGQSGAYGEGLFTIADTGSSLLITVGAGGMGRAGLTGNPGGSSSFGSLLSCPGGAGSTVLNDQVPPTVNGTGTQTAAPTGANLFSIRGGASAYSVVITATTVAMATAPGGRSYYGDGSPAVNGNTIPSNAVNPGSGGGGTVINNGWGGNITGANGANGIVIVYEFS